MNTHLHPIPRKILTVFLVLSILMTTAFASSCSLISRIIPSNRPTTSSTANNSTSAGKESSGTPTSDGNESTDNQDVQSLMAIDFKMFSSNVTTDSISLHLTVKDPEALGITVPAISLGKVSQDEVTKELAKEKDLLDQLKLINYDNLPRAYQITYDVIEYDLLESLAYEPYYYYSSPFNSITGLQTNLPLVMSEYSFDKKSDVDDYLLLVKDIYRYYGDLMTFEKERAAKGFAASDENIQKIIDSCTAFLDEGDDKSRSDHFMVTSFAQRLDTVTDLTDKEKQDYISQNQVMLDKYLFPAYQLLIDDFTALLGSGKNKGGLSNLPDGKDYYELLLQSESSSDISVSDGIAKLEAAIEQNITNIQSIKYDDQFKSAYSNYNFSKGSIQENLDYCKAAIEKDFPELIDHQVTLKQVPSQLEAFFSPAAYLSCRVDDPTNNLILTNKAALDGYQNTLGTVAHEGYPGHLYEAVYHAANIKSYYQRTASFKGYTEGWAVYAESYILEQSDYDQDLVKYVSAEDEIFNLLLPARIDIGVNYEGWDIKAVGDYLTQYNITESSYAEYCYNMAIEIPGYYMAYAIGGLNVKSIMTSLQKDFGDKVSMLDIHQAFLSIGAAPFPMIGKYIDAYVQDKEK